MWNIENIENINIKWMNRERKLQKRKKDWVKHWIGEEAERRTMKQLVWLPPSKKNKINKKIIDKYNKKYWCWY